MNKRGLIVLFFLTVVIICSFIVNAGVCSDFDGHYVDVPDGFRWPGPNDIAFCNVGQQFDGAMASCERYISDHHLSHAFCTSIRNTNFCSSVDRRFHTEGFPPIHPGNPCDIYSEKRALCFCYNLIVIASTRECERNSDCSYKGHLISGTKKCSLDKRKIIQQYQNYICSSTKRCVPGSKTWHTVTTCSNSKVCVKDSLGVRCIPKILSPISGGVINWFKATGNVVRSWFG